MEVLVRVQDRCRWPVDVLLLCVSISDSSSMFFDHAFQRSIRLPDVDLGTDMAGDAVYDARPLFHGDFILWSNQEHAQCFVRS